MPGALEEDFAPDAGMTPPDAPERTGRLGHMTTENWVWLAIGAVLFAWCVWAFLNDATLFVALLGSGLAKGAIVAIAAIGFVMIIKATGVANFAQGDLITLGAFVGFWASEKVAANGLGLPLGVAYALTLVIMFVVGVGIERVAYAPLRGRDVHVIVIATLGVALVIRTILAIWQGTNPRYMRSPFNAGGTFENLWPFKTGTLTITVGFLGIHDAVISAQRIVIMLLTLVIVLVMIRIFSRTSFGRQVRAIASDRDTARLYGVNANRLSMLSFGISGMLAGLAGILIGPLGSFDLTLGFTYMLLGFAAVTLGGFSNLGGVVIGGILIGLVEELFGGQLLPLIWSDALKYRATFPYVLMLVVIALKPQGLFGRIGGRL